MHVSQSIDYSRNANPIETPANLIKAAINRDRKSKSKSRFTSSTKVNASVNIDALASPRKNLRALSFRHVRTPMTSAQNGRVRDLKLNLGSSLRSIVSTAVSNRYQGMGALTSRKKQPKNPTIIKRHHILRASAKTDRNQNPENVSNMLNQRYLT